MINDSVLSGDGPLLLACNHPNSFLDAIIVGSMFRQPVHFLARGDAFRKPWVNGLLTIMKLIPIYRLSEGKEYLALNDATFEKCRQVLLNKGILLIFSEGLCVHDYTLRPLKKGTARIALDAWQQPAIAETFQVLPVGLNYNSFTHFYKTLIIYFGSCVKKEDVENGLSDGEWIIRFNQLLSEGIQEGMIEGNVESKAVPFVISNHRQLFASPGMEQLNAKAALLENELQQVHLSAPYYTAIKNKWSSWVLIIILAIPAIIGWLLHAPLYYPVRHFVKKKTMNTVFYDSVLFGLLLILYPLYFVLLVVFSFAFAAQGMVTMLVLCMPLLAWLYLQWKVNLQRLLNALRFTIPKI